MPGFLKLYSSKAFRYLKNTEFRQSRLFKLLIASVTVIALYLMLPSYKSTETNNEVGAIWSSEDLIAPFTFPVYKDESEYDLEVKEVKNNIAIVFDKVSEKVRIKDSLEKFETELRNILTAAENLGSKKFCTVHFNITAAINAGISCFN